MSHVIIRYNKDVEEAISRVKNEIVKDSSLSSKYNVRWLAIKLIENDEEVKARIKSSPLYDAIINVASEERRRLEKKYNTEADIVLANARYNFIGKIVRAASKGAKGLTFTDLIDKVILDKYLGIPIFIVVLWLMFQFTMIVSAPFCDLLSDLFSWLAGMWSGLTGNEVIDSLLFGDYGVLNGIGTVLGFVPLIFFLYFTISILEDSGYMARAAFVMDRAMRKMGLTGRSIISMILGFGCNVPAVYSTRAIPDEGDRVIATIVNPLMLCSARLTVFAMLAFAFFRNISGDIILSLYLIGIILALLLALLFRRIFYKGRISPFILELPQYQMPTLRSVFVHMWERGVMFFSKAGTVIFGGILFVGIFSHIQWPTLIWTNNIESSMMSAFGMGLQPIFAPLGWDWRLAVSAFFGFIAKEIVLGSMSLLYGVPEEGLSQALPALYTPLQAYAYMIFVLIYVPCIVTLAAIWHEQGWKWTILTVIYELILAYAASWLVMILGTLMGFG